MRRLKLMGELGPECEVVLRGGDGEGKLIFKVSYGRRLHERTRKLTSWSRAAIHHPRRFGHGLLNLQAYEPSNEIGFYPLFRKPI
jgi:hypothetical protein